MGEEVNPMSSKPFILGGVALAVGLTSLVTSYKACDKTKEEEKEKRDGALGTTASEEKEAAAMLEMKRLFAREKVLDVALKAVDDVMEGGTLLEQQKEEMQRIKMAKAALKTLVGKRGLLQACVEVRQGQTYRKEV